MRVCVVQGTGKVIQTVALVDPLQGDLRWSVCVPSLDLRYTVL